MREFMVGVDEAGRAPLAGPVSVGAVRTHRTFDFSATFPGLKDSKLLTPEKREKLYLIAKEEQQKGTITFCVRFSNHEYIDQYGITKAVRRAVWNSVRYLATPEEAEVYLDGLLHAPRAYTQQTVIHGDLLLPIISLASVLAKVERDRLMRRLSRRYPEYGFDEHKGYPTKAHYAKLKAHGLCAVHRRSFCKNILSVV